MLAGSLALGDVRDVEGLARRALDDALRSRGAHLKPHLYEDALQELLATAWQLWQRFDPARGLSFSTYAYRLLRLRVVDWYRSEFGDSRYGERPTVLSLDAPIARGSGADQTSEHRLEEIVGDRDADDEAPPIDLDVLREIDGKGELSEEGSRILREVALPLALGLNKDEVGDRLGRSRRHVNRCLDELRAELRAREERPPMTKTAKPKVPPTLSPTQLAPSCDRCLNYVLEQLEKEGLSRPEARASAIRQTRMVWIEKGKRAICRFCHPNVVPNRAIRRASARHGGWREPLGKAGRGPLRTPEIVESLAAERDRREEKHKERVVCKATARLEALAAVVAGVREEAA